MKRKQIILLLGAASLSLCAIYGSHFLASAVAIHAESSQESTAVQEESGQQGTDNMIYDTETTQENGYGVAYAVEDSGQSAEIGEHTESIQDKQEKFAPYAPYGMTYDVSKDQLSYNGKLVRYFIDSYPLEDDEGNEGICSSIEFFCESGTVDVYATRDFTHLIQNPDGSQDPSGTLTGLQEFSQEEFDARDIEAIKNPPVTTAIASEGGETTAADMLAMAEEYRPFGLTYDPQTDQWSYNGQKVNYFEDILTSNGATPSSGNFHGSIRTFGYDDNSGGVNIRTVRDYDHPNAEGNGILLRIEVDSKEKTQNE